MDAAFATFRTSLSSNHQLRVILDRYAGGQVAKGGRVGLFGNLDLMDTPFNSTNYTAEFMRNLQARSVADVWALRRRR